ncbi:MAG: phosphate ABC transporter substrate-binding protein PstS [Acidobacteriales bacterium]|nr:phosphate ABC transporter substrate-binding protein PstS [Candidatus Koribacter versatilis]MBI3644917.1 phosphate ABC transporter substrate-binding protein PstS [Terriglobales bacterium]
MEEDYRVIRRIALLLAGLALALPVLGQTTLNGAGATFPYPMYSKWFSEYNKLHSDVQINYQSIGSGGGIRQVLAGTVEFGASDGPMTDEQLSQAKVKILHIPTVLGAVVPAYNVPGVSGEIKFTPDVLANIFLNKITNWNDPAIAKANPGVTFPNQPIIVIHRSDGSGTTYIFTDYLSKISKEWEATVGKGTSVKWPIGLGGKGNEGVAGQIRQLQGSIGYVELIYAVQNNIPYGSVKNAAGTFVKATLEGVTEAAASVKSMPADFRVSITNAPGKTAYPIASFTWLLVPVQAKDPRNGKILADFLSWMVNDGQKMTTQLAYAPLPESVAEKVKATIKQVH